MYPGSFLQNYDIFVHPQLKKQDLKFMGLGFVLLFPTHPSQEAPGNHRDSTDQVTPLAYERQVLRDEGAM